MKLNVSIKNLGKISEGEVSLNRLTVFCGPNNTGKSYVSKALYSMFRAINSNHGWNLIGSDVERLNRYLELDFEEIDEDPLLQEIRELANKPPQLLARDDDDYAKLVRAIAKNKDFDAGALLSKSSKASKKPSKRRSSAIDVKRIEKLINKIKDFAKLSQEDMFEQAVKVTVSSLLSGNFMISRVSSLATGKNKSFSLAIKGAINLSASDKICKIEYGDVSKIREMPLVLYLDGMELKIDSGLARSISMYSRRHHTVPLTPYYHSDFLGILEEQAVTSDDLHDQLKRITDTIGGRLEYEEGRVYFNEKKGGRISASLASTGVRQLGTLGLLIERSALFENSTIFIDEPEANLHPSWQGVMAEVLEELALKGINIVIATHSTFMVQHMKYAAKNNKKLDKIMAVNHYSIDKGINGDTKKLKSNYDKLDYIQGELNEIYMRTLLQGINGD